MKTPSGAENPRFERFSFHLHCGMIFPLVSAHCSDDQALDLTLLPNFDLGSAFYGYLNSLFKLQNCLV